LAWIQSHQALGRHPKLKMLARLLKTTMPAAVGHLHYLWWWALDYAPEGDLLGYDSAVIAEAAAWKGRPATFIDAMLSSRFLEQVDGGYRLHDWDEYAGRLVKTRQKDASRKREERASKRTPEPQERTSSGRPADGDGTADVDKTRVEESREDNTPPSIPPAAQDGGRGSKPETPTQQLTAAFCEAVGREPVSRDYGQIGRLINQHGEAAVRYAIKQLTAVLMDEQIQRPFAWLTKVAAGYQPGDDEDEPGEVFDSDKALRQFEQDEAEYARREAQARAREARQRAAAAGTSGATGADGAGARAAAGAGG